jgi:uncharacterized membrane protein YhaH (DUF805 family)
MVFSTQREREGAMEWYSMVWRKYAQFDGRSRRKEYWMFTLFNLIAVMVLAGIGVAGIAMSNDNEVFLFLPCGIYSLAALIPSLSAATRRFHDIGKSGWMLVLLCVLGIIPFVGIVCSVIQIVFLCQDSQPGPNQYGPNPKFPEQAVGLFPGSIGLTPVAIGAQPQQVMTASSLVFCKSCGTKLTDGSPFCTNCGTRI